MIVENEYIYHDRSTSPLSKVCFWLEIPNPFIVIQSIILYDLNEEFMFISYEKTATALFDQEPPVPGG